MNIQLIVSDLLKTVPSQQELADLVPCSQSAIAAFLKGKRGKIRPSMVIGMRLVELHKQRCKKQKNEVPA